MLTVRKKVGSAPLHHFFITTRVPYAIYVIQTQHADPEPPPPPICTAGRKIAHFNMFWELAWANLGRASDSTENFVDDTYGCQGQPACTVHELQ